MLAVRYFQKVFINNPIFLFVNININNISTEFCFLYIWNDLSG